jgi:ankyrin repeat domain-containing protein 50
VSAFTNSFSAVLTRFYRCLHAKPQLEALRQCFSVLDMEETLVGLPNESGAIYMKTGERILGQGAKPSSLAKLVLLRVTHAKGELKINTLRRLVATSPETFAFEEKRMISEALLLSACCGLVSVDENARLAPLIREFYHRLSLLSLLIV